jgi:hypothetical protein
LPGAKRLLFFGSRTAKVSGKNFRLNLTKDKLNASKEDLRLNLVEPEPQLIRSLEVRWARGGSLQKVTKSNDFVEV